MKKAGSFNFWVFTVILLAVSGANTAVWGQRQQSEADALLASVYSYLSYYDYEGAIAECTEAIRLHPNDYRFFSLRGRSYSEMDDYTRAIDDYTQAIRVFSGGSSQELIFLYMYRANLYICTGDYNKAILDLTQAIDRLPISYSRYPTTPRRWEELFRLNLLSLRGLVYIKMGDYGRARGDFVFSLSPMFDDPYDHIINRPMNNLFNLFEENQ
jgi:tetratricopeptide (TPR) repeat protein